MFIHAQSYVGINGSQNGPGSKYINNITQNSAQISPISISKIGGTSETFSGKTTTASYAFSASSTIQNSNSTSGSLSLTGSETATVPPGGTFGVSAITNSNGFHIKSDTDSVLTITYNLTSSHNVFGFSTTLDIFYNTTSNFIDISKTSGDGTLSLSLTAAQMKKGVDIDTSISNIISVTNYNNHQPNNTDTESASCSVSWSLTPGSTGPSAAIAINNTSATNDNIISFNPADTGPPQTIPALISNMSSTAQTFQLSVNRSLNGTPYATLSQDSVTLPAGASTKITITPKADSSAANDVHIIATDGGKPVGEDDMTIVKVTVSEDIKNTDTPAGMDDRIPTVRPTTATVTVSPDLTGSGQSVTLAVTGQDANHGTVRINNQAAGQDLAITSSQPIDLSGVTQTAPSPIPTDFSAPYAKKLMLAVKVDGVIAVHSNGFSVANIPVNWTETFSAWASQDPAEQQRVPGDRGILVRDSWSSDGGGTIANDLTAIDLLEQVVLVSANPIGSFGSVKPQTKRSSATTNSRDAHTIEPPFGNLTESTGIVDQVHTFRDRRTGSGDFAVNNSGYEITYHVFFDSIANVWKITVTKAPKTVSVTVSIPVTGKPPKVIVFTSAAGSVTPRNDPVNIVDTDVVKSG
jgi:hypothetical protein